MQMQCVCFVVLMYVCECKYVRKQLCRCLLQCVGVLFSSLLIVCRERARERELQQQRARCAQSHNNKMCMSFVVVVDDVVVDIIMPVMRRAVIMQNRQRRSRR